MYVIREKLLLSFLKALVHGLVCFLPSSNELFGELGRESSIMWCPAPPPPESSLNVWDRVEKLSS